MEQFIQLSVLLVVIQLMSRASCINMPSKMPQGMYCEGCIATVTEIAKRVNKPSLDSREVRVVEAFENICHYSNFDTYAYSPPKTAKACNFLMELYVTKKEEFLTYVQDKKALVLQVCFNMSDLCDEWDKEELDMLMADPMARTKVQNDSKSLDLSAKHRQPETQIHVDYKDERTKIQLESENNELRENKKDKNEIVKGAAVSHAEQKLLKVKVEKSKIEEISPEMDFPMRIPEELREMGAIPIDMTRDEDDEGVYHGGGDDDEEEEEYGMEEEEEDDQVESEPVEHYDKEVEVNIHVPVVPAIAGEPEMPENKEEKKTEL